MNAKYTYERAKDFQDKIYVIELDQKDGANLFDLGNIEKYSPFSSEISALEWIANQEQAESSRFVLLRPDKIVELGLQSSMIIQQVS